VAKVKRSTTSRRWGVQRATFIIDPVGKVAHVIPKVSPKSHDEQVLKVLGDL
jgi:thioredoxin-dependent peroxiredoxin